MKTIAELADSWRQASTPKDRKAIGFQIGRMLRQIRQANSPPTSAS